VVGERRGRAAPPAIFFAQVIQDHLELKQRN